MNPGEHDHPDLTAHILGELDAEHSEAMAQWIKAHPETAAEAGQIAELARMLSDTAPVSFHLLHPHQRAAVLSGPQRVRQMVAAAKQTRPRTVSRFMPVLRGLGQFAAAAVMLIAGYLMGLHFKSQHQVPEVVSVPPAKQGDVPRTPPFRAKEVPLPVIADATTPETAKPDEPAKPATPVEPKYIGTVAAAAKVDLPSAASQPKAVASLPHNVVLSQAFVNTSPKGGLSQVSLRLADTRPAHAKGEKSPLHAAPMTAAPKDAHATRPDLLIHSWKADVASCPWNEAHRLVRLVVQIPGEQPAAAAPGSYPLQVNFSAAAVRSFRQLGERTLPAAQADAPAFHIVWYEVVPTGAAADGTPRTLGDVSIPNAHFTTQAMAAFDSSRLRILDQAATWQNAREDFLFESALVGFGLLLKGEKESGGLNHSLVLDLAQRSLKDDRTGEHAEFIKVVQEAQRMAGVK